MKAFTLRLPDVLYAQIVEQATAQDRPIARVILQYLRDGLASRQTASTDAGRIARAAYTYTTRRDAER